MNIMDLLARDPNVSAAFRKAVAPVSPAEARANYVKALSEHDWSYAFSDDGRVYDAGRRELEALQQMQRTLDPDFALWNTMCPKQCLNGASYR